MLRHIQLAILIILSSNAFCEGNTIASIRQTLESNSASVVQEKAYLHLDNTCYFIGDTIWYKAYVVRADDFHYTDMSRILYVELLNSDGLLVDRQQVIVSDKGYGAGCFALHDSLYTGYYELRAYTRWMLNFNVRHHRYGREDRHSFYNNAMANDFFRMWDGLYSRVVPVYGKPETPGNFDYKRMLQRPKQYVSKTEKEKLSAVFFPEGGHLLKGVPCRVAYELTDQEGRAVNVGGTLKAAGSKVADIRPTYEGRGVVTLTPTDDRVEAEFSWHDKNYTFKLPKAEDTGATMMLTDKHIDIASANLPADKQYAVSVICRGVLKHFEEIHFDVAGRASLQLPELPTGVNDLTLFDSDGHILADRLFFVNNHDYDGGNVCVERGAKTNYAPYEHVSLSLKCDGVSQPTVVSVAVRDTRTDEPTYDNGDMMTDLLLGSELKGFVANPKYYFEADDAEHRNNLDLLMMVQGWRKYKWQELADTAYATRRYQPEKTMTVDGAVYKTLSVNEVEPDEIKSWATGKGLARVKTNDEEDTEEQELLPGEVATDENGLISTDQSTSDTSDDETQTSMDLGSLFGANTDLGVNHGGLKHEVMVEAEVALGRQVAGLAQKTHNGGRFMFQIPPFYGKATLMMKAYNENDSTKKNMASHKDKFALDEDAYPDYYVKRDLFFPRFANEYSYYQNHAPEISLTGIPEEQASTLSMENDDHLLQNVSVKGKRRGKRAIDRTKPAYVADVYDIYNELTDCGLSYGKFDMRLFPIRVCQLLFGNMGRYVSFNVDAIIDRWVFYRTYTPDNSTTIWDNYNARALYDKLKLKRLDKLRIFSDYEPRRENADIASSRLAADATVELVPIANDGVQPSMRDRYIQIKGFNVPMEFYSPDYSAQHPSAPSDYRRTLYWNPNAVTDTEGRLQVDFFTGSKETRIKVSAAGLTADGKPLRTK